MFERLGLAYAAVTVADDVLDEQVDALEYLAIDDFDCGGDAARPTTHELGRRDRAAW